MLKVAKIATKKLPWYPAVAGQLDTMVTSSQDVKTQLDLKPAEKLVS